MAKFLITSPESAVREIQLKEGPNYFGRCAESDFQIDDASISSMHCEIIYADGTVLVKDIGSTNGTFIDGQPIQESFLQPGQRLHLGSVEMVYQADASSTPKPGLRVAIAPVTELRQTPPPAPLPNLRYVPPTPVEERTFFQELPAAFAYPFKRDGLILLICGTIVFTFLDFIGRFSFLISLLASGYLFAYMQKIVNSSGQGEEELPKWPEVSNIVEDILSPFLLMVGSVVVAFGPALAWFIWGVNKETGEGTGWLIVALVYGCFSLPMSVIAVSMYETLAALNPLLIIPSILKILGHYLVACILLAALIGIGAGLEMLLLSVAIPVLPTVVSGFVSLYFLTLEMRILGLLYFANRERLNWRF